MTYKKVPSIKSQKKKNIYEYEKKYIMSLEQLKLVEENPLLLSAMPYERTYKHPKEMEKENEKLLCKLRNELKIN
jgi:hypothetical protein